MKKHLYILFILFTATGFAQQKKWTLQECLNYAEKNNLQLKQSQFDIEQAKLNKQNALGLFLPNLNANASGSWNSGLTQNVTTGILETQTTFGGSGTISSNLNLFNGLKNRYTYKKSLLEILSAQYAFADLQYNINVQIVGAYVQILLNKENFESAQVQLENSIQQKEKTIEMIKAGILPQGDLTDAEAQITNDHLQVIQMENAYKLSKLNLTQLLELNDISIFDIDESLSGLGINQNLLQQSPEQLFEIALQHNKKIKQSVTQEQIADYQIKLVHSARMPSLSAFANLYSRYSDLDYYDFTGQVIPADPFWYQIQDNYGISYGLNLHIPVFNGFTVKNQVNSAKLSAEKVKINTVNTRKKLKSDIYKMYQDLQSAYQSMQAAEANLKAQRKAYDYAKEKFDVGMLNIFDLNNIKTKYMRAEIQYINAKYQYYLKSKVLEFTVN